MDQRKFDVLTKLLAGSVSRRAGVIGAFAALVGVANVPEADANKLAERRRERRQEQGQCRHAGTPCATSDECCSGRCKLKKDGRTRCTKPRNHPAKPGKKKHKKKGGGGGGGGIVIGGACDPQTDTCASPGATCTTYLDRSPSGTYCLYANGSTCAASNQCASSNCQGTCAAQVCTVCANGCAQTTVQGAITAANPGDVIRIDSGTYTEDLTITKNLTLANCNGSDVVLRNASDSRRTIILGDENNTSLNPALILVSVDITMNDSFQYGGCIKAWGSVELYGDTDIHDCVVYESGGGIYQLSGAPRWVKMWDDSQIRDNQADGGGGIYNGASGSTIELHHDASVTGNRTESSGGGGISSDAYNSVVRMYDRSSVTYNTSDNETGGILLGGNDANEFEMHHDSSVSHNTAEGGDYGGIYQGGGDWVLDGNAAIHDNRSVTGAGGGVGGSNSTINMSGNAAVRNNRCQGRGGGFNNGNTTVLNLSGNAVIEYNTSDTTGPGGVYDGEVHITENASIANNTPNNCQSVEGDCPDD